MMQEGRVLPGRQSQQAAFGHKRTHTKNRLVPLGAALSSTETQFYSPQHVHWYKN